MHTNMFLNKCLGLIHFEFLIKGVIRLLDTLSLYGMLLDAFEEVQFLHSKYIDILMFQLKYIIDTKRWVTQHWKIEVRIQTLIAEEIFSTNFFPKGQSSTNSSILNPDVVYMMYTLFPMNSRNATSRTTAVLVAMHCTRYSHKLKTICIYCN